MLHSATKGIAGHNDATLGVVAGERRAARRHLELLVLHGACASPYDATNGLRGIRTLAVRIARQSETALRLAEQLERHPAVAAVRYPGLASHPQHDLAKRQMAFGGSILAVDLAGGLEAGRRLRRGRAAGPDGVVARRPRDARQQPGQLDPRRAHRRTSWRRPASARDWCGSRSGSSTPTTCSPTSSRRSATERQGVSASSVVAAFDLAGTRIAISLSLPSSRKMAKRASPPVVRVSTDRAGSGR